MKATWATRHRAAPAVSSPAPPRRNGTKVVAEVQNGLGYLPAAIPPAGVTFTYDVRNVTLNLRGAVQGDGTFAPAKLVVNDFAINAGGWQLTKHPRLLGDTTGDGRADPRRVWRRWGVDLGVGGRGRAAGRLTPGLVRFPNPPGARPLAVAVGHHQRAGIRGSTSRGPLPL